jgi:hypothetical protein
VPFVGTSRCTYWVEVEGALAHATGAGPKPGGRFNQTHPALAKTPTAPRCRGAVLFRSARCLDQDAAARGVRLRELRWKNSAWLATAETIAGWNGLEIRNAGSGRSPVRKRSG